MSESTEESVILGLGSNQGDKKGNIEKSIALLEEKGFKLEKVSSLYTTSPQGNPNQPDFMNASVLGTTTASPLRLLNWCLETEKALGRDPDHPHWSPRTIDVDILFYGKYRIWNSELIIPHPRFHERLFALVPSVEVAPDFEMPDGSLLREYYESRLDTFDFPGQMVEKLAD